MALYLIIEGMLPALSPQRFREVLAKAQQLSDAQLRNMGLIAMLLGAALLYWIK